tara:strand:+ start:1454 stop:2071 length:618 start_codon:yes stop_codon:yes gene_type:complete
MAKKLNQEDASGLAYKNQQINQIGTSSELAAQKLISGAQDYEARLKKAMPQAERALYGQAAAGLAAGAAQAGRGGASAYGGALQGGLQAAQQAAGFGFTSAQALADAARMQSEGYATEATAADKMLQYGTASERLAEAKMNVEKMIQDAIKSANNKDDYERNVSAIRQFVESEPELLMYYVNRVSEIGDPYENQFRWTDPSTWFN